METIIHRDCVGAARDPWFRMLRWMAAILAVLLLWFLTRNAVGPTHGTGRMVFVRMQWTLSVFLLGAGAWLGAPLLLRERREGTLALLFLTGLRPWQFVLGKAAGGFLRLLGVWFVTIPACVVPIVLGGVRILDVLEFLLGDLAMIVTGLIAGLMASAVVRHPPLLFRTTVGMAAMLGVMFLTWLTAARLLLSRSSILSLVLPSVIMAVWMGVVTVLGLWMITGALQRSLDEEDVPGTRRPDPAGDVEQMEEKQRQEFWRCGPGALMRGRHPLLWLRRRAPGQSPTAWIWTGLVLVGWVAFIITERAWVGEMIGCLLVGAIGARAVRGYRGEIQEGVMELLMTTPLTERAFLRMPIRQALAEFGVPVLLHLLIGGWMSRVAPESVGIRWERLGWVALAPWTGTWVALWVSSWIRHRIPAAGGAIGASLLPVAAGMLPDWPGPAVVGAMTWAGFLGIGVVAHHWLVRDLRSRSFVLRQMPGGAGEGVGLS